MTDIRFFILCVRWTNPSQDMIVCVKCQAVVAVAFHPLLKAADEFRIANIYREQLCTAHKVTCPFHSNAFPKGNTVTTVPSYLGSVLPQESVQLFEQINPKVVLQKQVKLLLEAVGERREPVPLDLSTTEMKECMNDDETVESFVSRVANALGCGDDEWVATLALLCWQPVENRQQSRHSGTSTMLQCPVCLACCELHLHDREESDNSSVDDLRPAKKRKSIHPKQMNPMTAHRHYCPVIFGFPTQDSKEPMWQKIASNLLQAEAANEGIHEIKGEEVMMNIHRLLQSGLR